MRAFACLVIICFLTGCGHRMMTMDSYHNVPLGISEKKLVEMAGSPYSTKELKGGKMQYEYVERIPMGSRTVEERHYYFVLQNGQVINKYMKSFSPPPYIENSYDMQSTTNNDTTSNSD